MSEYYDDDESKGADGDEEVQTAPAAIDEISKTRRRTPTATPSPSRGTYKSSGLLCLCHALPVKPMSLGLSLPHSPSAARLTPTITLTITSRDFLSLF